MVGGIQSSSNVSKNVWQWGSFGPRATSFYEKLRGYFPARTSEALSLKGRVGLCALGLACVAAVVYFVYQSGYFFTSKLPEETKSSQEIDEDKKEFSIKPTEQQVKGSFASLEAFKNAAQTMPPVNIEIPEDYNISPKQMSAVVMKGQSKEGGLVVFIKVGYLFTEKYIDHDKLTQAAGNSLQKKDNRFYAEVVLALVEETSEQGKGRVHLANADKLSLLFEVSSSKSLLVPAQAEDRVNETLQCDLAKLLSGQSLGTQDGSFKLRLSPPVVN